MKTYFSISVFSISVFLLVGCSSTRVETPNFKYSRVQTGTKVQLKSAEHTTLRSTNSLGVVTISDTWRLEGVLSDAVEGFKAGLDAGIKAAALAKP